MPIEQAATSLTLFWMVSVFVLYVTEVAGSTAYDVNELKKQRDRLKHPNAKQYRRKPLVSVIIPAHNAETTIENTLDSILTGSYRKVEVIVINDASTDDTEAVLTAYKSKYPKRSVQFLNKRKLVGPTKALEGGLRKAKGEYAMLLAATDSLNKNTIQQAVWQFASQETDVIVPQTLIKSHPSLIGLVQRFDSYTQNQTKKLSLQVPSGYIIGGSGSLYRKDALKRVKNFTYAAWTNRQAVNQATKKLAKQSLRSHYASDVIINTLPTLSYTQLFKQQYRRTTGNFQTMAIKSLVSADRAGVIDKLRRILFVWSKVALILEPWIMLYFLFLAFSFKQPVFYLIAWLTLSCLLGFTVLRNTELTKRDRLKALVFLPIIYNLLYIVRLMEIVSLLIQSLNFGQLFNKQVTTKKHPKWVLRFARSRA